MFKLVCIIGCSSLLCQMVLGDDSDSVCIEKKADGTIINHKPGDKWLEHPDQDTKGNASVVIKYTMTCVQDGDGIKVKPAQCYFEDIRTVPLLQGMFVEPGCYKLYGQWLTKCVWNGDHLDAMYTNGGGSEEVKMESEGIKWC